MQQDMGQMMQRMLQERQQQQQGGRQQGGQQSQAKAFAALASAYPKMKEHADQMAIKDTERKAKKMKFDMMLKKAEQAFKLKQQQQEMAQQAQQIQAARGSV